VQPVPAVRSTYQVHEFAALSGVTIKTLHHYDRLGLLKPRRSTAGYRVYTQADLERLEQIVALKFIGLPLKQIKVLLEHGLPRLPEALRLQRQALEAQQRRLSRAVDALRTAESALPADGSAADPDVLRRLIEAIAMEDKVEILKTYFGDEAWTRWKARRSPGAVREWDELYRDIDAALDQDVRSQHARSLAERWLALIESEVGGDPSVRTGLIKAWTEGHRLPALLQPRTADLDLTKATRFVADVLWAKWDDERRAQAPTAIRHKANESRIALVRRIVAALDKDPAGAEGRELAAAWHELLRREAADDAATIAALETVWRTQRQWPVGLRNYIASLHEVDADTWDRVVDFVDAASAAQA
jgi:MerR family transcriptional regulator, thiopeptide resistance regulator